MSGPVSQSLTEVLERARSVGFLGPGPVADHIAHAEGFRAALVADGLTGGRMADIGSGGGVPGLALLVAEPELSAVLIDASQKRCSFLVWAVATLGLGHRAEVWCARAERLGHEERAREGFDVVVARGFGPPATTLECGTALIRPGGRLVVSEPPQRRSWPAEPLSRLALRELPTSLGVAVFERLDGLADRYPRSSKELQRAPLFTME